MTPRRRPGRLDARSPRGAPGEVVPPPVAIPWRDSLLVGLAALVATLPLTPDVSGDKDAGEFALVLARFGAAHPTGYPIYTLIGGAFVHVLHAVGLHRVWAANAWSAAGGAVAAALLHALAARLLAREGAARLEATAGGVLAAGAFVFHPLWTAATTQAEVHSWHVAWVLGATLAALAFARPRGGDSPPGARDRFPPALAWGALVGIGLAHHVTSVLVSAPLTLALALAHAGLRPARARGVLLFALGLVVPLLGYVFIAWRAFHPTAGQWGALAPNASSILAHVTGREYRVYGGHFAPSAEERGVIDHQVVPWLAVSVPAAIAWGFAARRTPAALRLGILGAIGATLVFVRFYGVADPSAYFLPPLALSLAVFPTLSGALVPSRFRRPLALALTLAVAVAGVAGVRLALARNAAFRAEDAHVHGLWRSIAAERGFVLWSDDRISILRGYQLLDGEKPELEVDHPLLLTQDWPRAQFVARHGFDPVSRPEIAAAAARTHPRDLQELAALMSDVIALRVNAHSPLPVMRFLPESNAVRTLPKGAAAESLLETVAPNSGAPPATR